MSRFCLQLGMIAVGLLLGASVAFGSVNGWRVIGHASASGQFAAAAASGSANHPNAIAVRISGGGTVTGFGAVACSKGIGSIGSTSTTYHGHFALLKLPMKNADSCQVTASASGSGHLRLEIVAR